MKQMLIKIALGFLLLIIGLFLPSGGIAEFIAFIIGYLVLGADILWKAIKNIWKGQIFDENLLMSVATIGAFILGEYPEGVAVMLFYQIGEVFGNYATDRSKRSVQSLIDIRPDYANKIVDGRPQRVSPSQINVGELIMVKPGERFPLDGIISEGLSSIDTSALTGESLPRKVKSGDTVLNGCINLTGTLIVVVSKVYGESAMSRILNLVQNAADKKAQTEKFVTKFAKGYTPIVISAAVLIALVPPFIIQGSTFDQWIYRALVFLVISCPCALVISIPLGFFCGIGLASNYGILVKGSNYIEGLATAAAVVFDKTGTLTKGSFSVTKVRPVGMDRDMFLNIASHAELHSSHPISASIRSAYDKNLNERRIANVKDISGYGIEAIVDNKTVLLGNERLMKMKNINKPEVSPQLGSVIHMSVNGTYAGYAVIADKIKEDSKEAIERLRSLGINRIAILTGDSKSVGDEVANTLGVDYVASELLPEDKTDKLEDLSRSMSQDGPLIFVGDGINDAPVLARADIGVAMGAMGSDAAVETADVVIMDDKPSKVAQSIIISRKTMRISKQNIVFSLGIKCVILLLGIIGISTMWEAVFADVGVTVVVVLNSMRILKGKIKFSDN